MGAGVQDPLGARIDSGVDCRPVLRDDVSGEVVGGDQQYLLAILKRVAQGRGIVIAPLPYAHPLVGQMARTLGIADADADSGRRKPLEEVLDRGSVETAHVSKATIFNRFGGRIGLIDAVVDDVVAAELMDVIEATRSVTDRLDRIPCYVRGLRDLQYRVPAINDVLLQEFPDSQALMGLCRDAGGFHDSLLEEGHAAGVLAEGFTPDDFHVMTVDNALALKHGGRPPRVDYDRRSTLVLGGICLSSTG